MSDFTELEAELKKLRPHAASPELAARVEQALAEVSGRTATAGVLPKPRSFRVNWLGLGLGLAAAAAFLVLARVNVDRPGKRQSVVAMTPAPFAPPDSAQRRVRAGRSDPGCLQHARRRAAFPRGRRPTGPPRALTEARDLAMAQSRDRHVAARFVSERGSHLHPCFRPVTKHDHDDKTICKAGPPACLTRMQQWQGRRGDRLASPRFT